MGTEVNIREIAGVFADVSGFGGGLVLGSAKSEDAAARKVMAYNNFLVNQQEVVIFQYVQN